MSSINSVASAYFFKPFLFPLLPEPHYAHTGVLMVSRACLVLSCCIAFVLLSPLASPASLLWWSLAYSSRLSLSLCCQGLWWSYTELFLAGGLVASSLSFSYRTSATSWELTFFLCQIVDFPRVGLSLIISVSWKYGRGLAYNVYCQIEFLNSGLLQWKVWGEMRLPVDINCNCIENAKDINSES